MLGRERGEGLLTFAGRRSQVGTKILPFTKDEKWANRLFAELFTANCDFFSLLFFFARKKSIYTQRLPPFFSPENEKKK